MKNKNVYIIGFGYLGLPLAFVIDHRSRITEQITHYRSRITHHTLPITHYASPITHYWSRVTDTMSEIVNQSMQKTFLQAKTFTKNAYAIAKGTGIIFTGTISGMLLGFGRVIIVRYTTQTEYGIYSRTLVLMSIFVTISMWDFKKAQQDTSLTLFIYYTLPIK